MKLQIVLASILASKTFSEDVVDLDALKLVHVLYRHGDRMPIKPYPNDPYKDPSKWPLGFGQLSSVGKMQQFELGKFLRNRYNGYLSANYSEKEIVVRSTDVDRTLMSALSNLAGLYPPSGYLKWKPDLLWQPIPVHTVPQKEDRLLSSHANCPRFDELHRDVLENSDFMKNIYEENKGLFQNISINTGENITDIVHLDYIFDTLLIEDLYNMTLPSWTVGYYPGGKFKELRDLSFSVDTFTHEMKRLKGGPFIQEMVDHFDAVLKGSETPKMFMYSAHDTTVAPVLDTLGVFNMIAPPYSSMIIVELFQHKDSHFVKVSYKNDTSESPYELSLPECQAMCPLDKFKDLTSSVRISPERWRIECGFSDESSTTQKVTLVAAIVSTLMAMSVLIATFVNIWCKKEKHEFSARYQRVDQMEH